MLETYNLDCHNKYKCSVLQGVSRSLSEYHVTIQKKGTTDDKNLRYEYVEIAKIVMV